MKKETIRDVFIFGLTQFSWFLLLSNMISTCHFQQWNSLSKIQIQHKSKPCNGKSLDWWWLAICMCQCSIAERLQKPHNFYTAPINHLQMHAEVELRRHDSKMLSIYHSTIRKKNIIIIHLKMKLKQILRFAYLRFVQQIN